MKKTTRSLLALLLACSLCLSFVACDTATDETTDNNNIGEDGVLTIVVATDGSDETGDGTAEKPFATLTAARDAIREIDKTELNGIDVLIKAGQYTASETFLLTAEDSGTAECPIRYVGEDGAYFYGGVAFTADAFEPLGDTETVQYFPEEVRKHLVQIDLKQFGFTPDDVREMVYVGGGDHANSPLYCDGEKMTVARFPNEEDGWARIKYGHVEVEEGEDPEHISYWHEVVTTIEFDE